MINNTRSQFWRRDDIVLKSPQSTYKHWQNRYKIQAKTDTRYKIQNKAKTMGNTYYKTKLFPQTPKYKQMGTNQQQ